MKKDSPGVPQSLPPWRLCLSGVRAPTGNHALCSMLVIGTFEQKSWQASGMSLRTELLSCQWQSQESHILSYLRAFLQSCWWSRRHRHRATMDRVTSQHALGTNCIGRAFLVHSLDSPYQAEGLPLPDLPLTPFDCSWKDLWGSFVPRNLTIYVPARLPQFRNDPSSKLYAFNSPLPLFKWYHISVVVQARQLGLISSNLLLSLIHAYLLCHQLCPFTFQWSSKYTHFSLSLWPYPKFKLPLSLA